MIWLRTTGLRLALATGLAFALWFFVSYTENPDMTASFEGLPVSIDNLTPGLMLVDNSGLQRNSLPTANLTIEAQQDTTTTLKPNDFEPYIDLKGLNQGDHVVPINVKTTRSGLNQVTIATNPDRVSIRIEQEITRTIPLTLTITGNVPFSFEQEPARATMKGQPISMVQVHGPQNRVERIVMARATANIDGRTANYNSPRVVEALSENGQVVDGVEVEPQFVDVLVPIISSVGVKRVPVVPNITGEPGSGFIVVGLSVDPQFVNLTGSSGPLDRVQQVSTTAVDVSGATENVVRTVTIEPLANTSIQAGQPTTATVSLQVVPIERPFSVTLPVPVQGVNPPEGMLVTISPQIVQVRITGPAGQLGALDPSMLQGIVSLRDLRPGTYALTPAIDLPQGLAIEGSVPKVTVTLRIPASPTPQAVPTTTTALAATPQPSSESTTAPIQEPASPVPADDATAGPTPAPAAGTPSS